MRVVFRAMVAVLHCWFILLVLFALLVHVLRQACGQAGLHMAWRWISGWRFGLTFVLLALIILGSHGTVCATGQHDGFVRVGIALAALGNGWCCSLTRSILSSSSRCSLRDHSLVSGMRRSITAVIGMRMGNASALLLVLSHLFLVGTYAENSMVLLPSMHIPWTRACLSQASAKVIAHAFGSWFAGFLGLIDLHWAYVAGYCCMVFRLGIMYVLAG